MPKLRKTLPKAFKDFYWHHDIVWTQEDIERVKDMLLPCDPNAYLSRANPQTILFFYVPIEIIRWAIGRGTDVNAATAWGTALFPHARVGERDICQQLLSHGADVDAAAYDGSTALHHAASRGQVEIIQLLLSFGADPCRRTGDIWGGRTPLLEMLAGFEGMVKERFADTAALLVAEERKRRPLSATDWAMARKEVARIARQYQVFRADWKVRSEVREGDAAMERLSALFDVEPAPPIIKHDGKEKIVVDGSLPPRRRFDALHEYLVPLADTPLTLQGEVIRMVGAVDHEVSDNGAVNWNKSFPAMLVRLLTYFRCGHPLSKADQTAAEALVALIILKKGYACWDETGRLKDLAVTWVTQNPDPMTG